jgi:hypothetical protein
VCRRAGVPPGAAKVGRPGSAPDSRRREIPVSGSWAQTQDSLKFVFFKLFWTKLILLIPDFVKINPKSGTMAAIS